MKIELSLTPALYPYRTLSAHHTTVVVDLLRATTAVCAAFQAGCRSVVPLDSLEPLPRYRDMGYLLAAERNGEKVGDAEYGNSPTEYLRHDLAGQRLAYSTTNGTVALLRAADAERVYAGCFANLSALADRLLADGKDVVVMCSGWKNDFSLEDTLVAGALAERLPQAEPVGDAIMMARALWQQAKADPYAYCDHASHVERLRRLGAADDVSFAFRTDTCPVVPRLENGSLTL